MRIIQNILSKELRFNALYMLLCFAALFLIGITDYVTGSYISLSVFFLVPIMIGTWKMGRTSGIILSLASAVVCFTSDHLAGPANQNFLIPYWNAFVRLCFFLTSCYLLSEVRMLLSHEQDLSRKDSLTDVYNSRAFYEFANVEIERTRRHGAPFSVAYLDVDDFKTVNDTKGHTTGDGLLSLVADIIKTDMRSMDVVARLGGDEFAVLMPETNDVDAVGVMERVRERLLEEMKRNDWPATFSIGVATFDTPPVSVNDMIKEADNLMYDVKNSGKNAIKSKTFDVFPNALMALEGTSHALRS